MKKKKEENTVQNRITCKNILNLNAWPAHLFPLLLLVLRSLLSTGHSRQQVTLVLKSLSSSGQSRPQVSLVLRSLSSSNHSRPQVTLVLKSLSSSGHSRPQVTLVLKSLSSSGHSRHQVTVVLRSLSSSGHPRVPGSFSSASPDFVICSIIIIIMPQHYHRRLAFLFCY